MKCTSQNLYQSIEQCDGSINTPGMARRLYYIAKRDIVTWPTIERPDSQVVGLTAEKIVSYAENFVLVADAKWKSIDVIRDKSSFSSETQGEQHGKTFLNKAELIVAGSSYNVVANAALMANSNMVFLVQKADRKFIVIGCDFYDGAITSTGVVSGAAATDAHITTLSIEGADFVPLPFYPGTIETEAGDISGADGSIVVPA